MYVCMYMYIHTYIYMLTYTHMYIYMHGAKRVNITKTAYAHSLSPCCPQAGAQKDPNFDRRFLAV